MSNMEQKMMKEQEDGKRPVDGGGVGAAAKAEERVEPKTGVSLAVVLPDGKRLAAVGLRRKKIMASVNLNIYAFGIYADEQQLRALLLKDQPKLAGAPAAELCRAVIDSDAGMTVQLVIVFARITMSMVRKQFGEALGAAIKKLNGGKEDAELAKRVLGDAGDGIKLPRGSIVEISRCPGYILETKVKGETVSSVESELLCRAYFTLYLGDDPFDDGAKQEFTAALLALF